MKRVAPTNRAVGGTGMSHSFSKDGRLQSRPDRPLKKCLAVKLAVKPARPPTRKRPYRLKMNSKGWWTQLYTRRTPYSRFRDPESNSPPRHTTPTGSGGNAREARVHGHALPWPLLVLQRLDRRQPPLGGASSWRNEPRALAHAGRVETRRVTREGSRSEPPCLAIVATGR